MILLSDNNLSERELTCYRSNINFTDALIRLMEDNPYTVEEIFNKEND